MPVLLYKVTFTSTDIRVKEIHFLIHETNPTRAFDVAKSLVPSAFFEFQASEALEEA